VLVHRSYFTLQDPVFWSILSVNSFAGRIYFLSVSHQRPFYRLTRAPLCPQDFWTQCVAAGCAFFPGVSSEGVFPLLYLRGRSFMMVALGRDDAACQRIYHTADRILNAAAAEAAAQIVPPTPTPAA